MNQPGKIASQFTRELGKDAETRKEYEALTSHKDKAEFRSRWAALKLKQCTSKLELMKTEVHTMDDTSKGTYLPFRRLWEQEGLDKTGFEALLGTRAHPITQCVKRYQKLSGGCSRQLAMSPAT